MLESDVRLSQEKGVNGWSRSVIFQVDFFAKNITVETIAQRKRFVTKCPKNCAKIEHADFVEVVEYVKANF